MNGVELFLSQKSKNPKKMALWFPESGVTTFGELESLTVSAQKIFNGYGLKCGDTVLLVDNLGPRLYGAIIGLLALGVGVILVEPWMPVEKINHVIELVKPKLFLTNLLGKIWAARLSSVRHIPHWISVNKIKSVEKGSLKLESVSEDTAGIITFTSGTTGNPKGVVRRHGYMVAQHQVLSKHLGDHLGEDKSSPDLCIFANFALLNLASGRGSLIFPTKWKKKYFEQIDALPKELQPVSATCGPAFLLELLKHSKLKEIKSFHVGGALTDCKIFENGFAKWPEAHWTHVYGSSEAEPVAVVDAKYAVAKSLEREYFQTLVLGSPIDEIKSELGTNGVWVTGPHVCPEYLGNAKENEFYKKRDQEGRVWHFMGDRVRAGEGEDTWWYSGRSQQNLTEFELEQRIYWFLKSSQGFIARNKAGQIFYMGEKVKVMEQELLKKFPELHSVTELKIYRDTRHRARIDRLKSLKKGAPWFVG